METFGETIKRLRTSRGITQEEFGDMLGTSKQVISRYEKSQRVPKISVVLKMADALQVPVSIILGDAKDRLCDIMLPAIEIGQRIKHTREERELTLEELAKRVGIHKSTILRYEQGKIERIKLPVIRSIAAALNVNPSWIVGVSENKYSASTRTICDADGSDLPDEKTAELVDLISRLTEQQKSLIIAQIKGILSSNEEG